jgi:hypothetical protein
MDTLPASLEATTLPATVTLIAGDTATLTLKDTGEAVRWPANLLPLGVGPGATVYLRALSAAGLGDESEAVARKIVEQFLN